MAEEDGEKPADQASDAKATDEPQATDAGSEASNASKSAAVDVPSEPKKKKKKKKKKRALEANDETSDEQKDDEPRGPVLGPEGWERPAFVLDFPKDPELDRLVRAFELGNYAFVREHAKKLAEGAGDDAVRRAACELLRRLEPDPLVKLLFFMSLGLLAFMIFYAYRSHGH